MMTKKDFIALAAGLKAVKPEMNDAAYWQWAACVRAVWLACRASNPHFDVRKFVAACGTPNLLVGQ